MNSSLLDLIEACRFKFLKMNESSDYGDEAEKTKNELSKTLNEQQIKQLNSILSDLDWHYDEIYHDYCVKILNFGIKVGMQIQEYFEFMNG